MRVVSSAWSGDSAAAGRKIAHTIPEAVLASGLSRSLLYLAIGRGELRARKCGARTVILDSDLRRFLRNLPALVAEQPPPEIGGSQSGNRDGKSVASKRGRRRDDK
jgi:hypothetical protein